MSVRAATPREVRGRGPSESSVALRNAIAAREYRLSENAKGLQAPNRRQGLRTYFEADGIVVEDRVASSQGPLLSLQLSAWGRAGSMTGAKPGVVSHEATRAEIARPGLLEWFENGPKGLEHGFVLEERPDGHGPLVFELAARHARARSRESAVEFTTSSGRRLRYDKLEVLDARGARVDAHLEVVDVQRLALVIDDRSATYPIVVDPLLSAGADAIIEASQAQVFFGGSTASAGDVNGDGFVDLIVGASRHDAGEEGEGAAFIFLGSETGFVDTTPAGADTQLEGNLEGAEFGTWVASAGDVNGDGFADVIVGAPSVSEGQSLERGGAYVFLGSPSGIADGGPATAATRLETTQERVELGRRVASAGDVNGDGYDDIIVSTRFYDLGGVQRQPAFLYYGSATGIPHGSPETADAWVDVEGAVLSVASAGDVNGDGYADVIVGAFTDLGADVRGSAFVFHGSSAGIPPDGSAVAATRIDNDLATTVSTGSIAFAFSVASAGDVNGDGFGDVIIGAPGYAIGPAGEGLAFIYHGSASGVAELPLIQAATWLLGNQQGALLGLSVSGAGDVNGDGFGDVIVGAPEYDGATQDTGAAFVFLGSASGIPDTPAQAAFAGIEGPGGIGLFGESVAAAGDVDRDGFADVIVGDPGASGIASNAGAAYVYRGSSGGLGAGGRSVEHVRLTSGQENGALGTAIAPAGDVNGDGFGDVILGMPSYDAGGPNVGAVFVVEGGPDGIDVTDPFDADVLLGTPGSSSRFGADVDSAGDVNGDGFDDVIVGAWLGATSTAGNGEAYVFLGSASGIEAAGPESAHATLSSDRPGGIFGYSVAGAGDVNGDGFADIAVGDASFSNPELREGAFFVWHGSVVGIDEGSYEEADARVESNVEGAFLGSRIRGAGDVNGDGRADLIAVSPFWSTPFPGAGAAFVFAGGQRGIASGDVSSSLLQILPDRADAFVESADGAGDVDGDGYADVIVGAYGYTAGELQEGGAFVFHGGPSLPSSIDFSQADATIESDRVSAWLGITVAGAGDVNGDGFADVAVGASRFSDGGPEEGAAFVFLGSEAGIEGGTISSASARIQLDQPGAAVGSAVAGLGDVNGDGFSDVAIGASGFTDTVAGEGAALVYLGAGTGRPTRARQTRAPPAGDCGTLPDIAVPPSTTTLHLDEGEWTVAANIAAGSVEGFDTTPENVARAAELVAPPVQNEFLPAILTFDAAETGLCPSFTIEALQPGSAFTYDDGEPSPATWPLGSLSVGDINDFEDDDFRIDFTARQPWAVALDVVDNFNDVSESFTVLGAGDKVLLTVDGTSFSPSSAEGAFLGVVASEPIHAIVFDEGSGGDDIGLRDLRLAPAAGPVRIAPWAWSRTADGFTVEMQASHPAGTGRVKIEVEACPGSTPFGTLGCSVQTSPVWEVVDGTRPEVRITTHVIGLVEGAVHRWRARTLYAPRTGSTTASPSQSPWRRPGAQVEESDIRVPEPSVGALFFGGLAGLIAIARRRPFRAGSSMHMQ